MTIRPATATGRPAVSRPRPLALAALVVLWLHALTVPAQALTEPEALVERARLTALTLIDDPEYDDLKALAERARALLIVPNLLQAGFVLGGGGGSAVLLARGPDGLWSPPAFYTIAKASFGLQIGGQSSQVILAIMTDKGLNAVLDRKVKLGADASIAVGEIGKGVSAATGAALDADMYAFYKSAGLYGGATFEGAVIAPRDDWNDNYYQGSPEPRAILVERTVDNPQADALRAALP